MYSGCSGKEVFQRLKSIYLTVTHKIAITCINQLGDDFDQAVNNWRDAFLPSLQIDLAEVLRAVIKNIMQYKAA